MSDYDEDREEYNSYWAAKGSRRAAKSVPTMARTVSGSGHL